MLPAALDVDDTSLSLDAMARENIEYVVIAFQSTSEGIPSVNNHRVILSSQAKENKEYAMTKYHILFTKKTKIKATKTKSSCIARTKSINKIQHNKFHKNHVALLYILHYYQAVVAYLIVR